MKSQKFHDKNENVRPPGTFRKLQSTTELAHSCTRFPCYLGMEIYFFSSLLCSCYERLSIAPGLWKILNNRALSDFLMCLGLIFDQLTTAFPYCHNSAPCRNKFEVQFLTLKPNALFFLFSLAKKMRKQLRAAEI